MSYSRVLLPLVVFICSACDGPLAIIPGGALSGEQHVLSNDVIPQSNSVIELETRPSNPYSVNVNSTVINQQLYIDPAPGRTWYKYITNNPNVKVRFEGNPIVYSTVVEEVIEEKLLKQFEADRVVLRLSY